MAKLSLPRPKAILRAQIIKSLAHPSRIQMVEALGSGEMCVEASGIAEIRRACGGGKARAQPVLQPEMQMSGRIFSVCG